MSVLTLVEVLSTGPRHGAGTYPEREGFTLNATPSTVFGATRTTLADETGTVHRVTLPHIPANYPDGGSVTVRAHCGAGRYNTLPARLARQANHPTFLNRQVTCPTCLTCEDCR